MGCRVKAAKATLLRVVVVGGVLVPDPAGRLPGRGASVHLDLQCVDLAEKRRAFPRALRLTGPLDVVGVRDHVAQRLGAPPDQQDSPQHDPHPHDPHDDPHPHDPHDDQPARTARREQAPP